MKTNRKKLSDNNNSELNFSDSGGAGIIALNKQCRRTITKTSSLKSNSTPPLLIYDKLFKQLSSIIMKDIISKYGLHNIDQKYIFIPDLEYPRFRISSNLSNNHCFRFILFRDLYDDSAIKLLISFSLKNPDIPPSIQTYTLCDGTNHEILWLNLETGTKFSTIQLAYHYLNQL